VACICISCMRHAGGLKPRAAMQTELIVYKSLASEIKNTDKTKTNQQKQMLFIGLLLYNVAVLFLKNKTAIILRQCNLSRRQNVAVQSVFH